MNVITSPPSLVALRQDLHRHPELRFEEHRTAAVLAARLRNAGFVVREGLAGTGLVATIGDPDSRPHVLVRADMDAVPTPDPKAVEYASQTPGVAHACGHDVHMSVAVGVGEQLAVDGLPGGRLSLLFQPAEEIPFGESSGAQAMIEAGAIEDGADVVLALHCWPDLPVGTIGVDRVVAMAAKDAFRIRYRGVPAHAATPSRGRDALLGISDLVVALHHLLGRRIDPGEQAALNVGTISGGSSQSIVPERAEITGTLRTVDQSVRARLREAIERQVTAIAEGACLEHDLEWANEMPPVVNDERLVARALARLPGVLGEGGLQVMTDPPMTTDDFALYTERIPGLYVKLGVCPPGAKSCCSLHDGRFDVDERAIGVGVAALSELVRDLLEHPLASAQPDASTPTTATSARSIEVIR